MKVLSDKKVRLLNLEYDMVKGETRNDAFEWLDKEFGEFGWRSKRSGPSDNKVGKGLVVVEIEI
jgi:hypothetical protein